MPKMSEQSIAALRSALTGKGPKAAPDELAPASLAAAASAPVPPPPAEGEAPRRPITVDDFCALANKFVSQQMYHEAIQLYETAIRLFPSSLALKINLGRVRDLQRRSESASKDSLRKEVVKEREDSDRLASCYMGLASIYLESGKTDKALEFLEIAKHQNANLHLAHYHLGHLFHKQDDLDRALGELELAIDVNPFHEDTRALLAKVYTERGDYESALQNYIDAFLLSLLRQPEGNPFYKSKIKYLFDKLGVEEKQGRNEAVRRRMKVLNETVQALEERKKQFFESSSFARVTKLVASTREHHQVRNDRLRVALRLRRFPLMQDLTDDELYKLAKLASVKKFEAGEYIFHEGDDSGYLALLESGKIRLVCPTPVGEQEIGLIVPQEYFGEMNFIDKGNHASSAVANEDCVVWALDNKSLDRLFEVERELSVHFYWHFWRALAQRTRRTNELMKSFFADMGAPPEEEKPAAAAVEAEDADVGMEEKLEMLATRGLSSKEMRLLATFSTEKRYAPGACLFREGDPGDKLFIVLDGKVVISKSIPGVGEEALAVLERGDFFGEMALVDESPRSADARAHDDMGCVVLAIEKRALDEILSLDVESAYQFLHLLCKILTHRLREITSKLTRWRIMSGGFG
jgi:CRP-like cAMP-binding protein